MRSASTRDGPGDVHIFALTGDWRRQHSTPVFDLESVQLTEFIASLRAAHGRRTTSRSPYRVQVPARGLPLQYFKLEKKIGLGADLAITQVGWVRAIRELRNTGGHRRLTTPLLGNVFVLSYKAAQRMATGVPPGCWASPALVAALQQESTAADGGLGARLERAAMQVATLKGLGYAGAYIGGTHNAVHIRRILDRAAELEPRWQECADQVQFGDPHGFYVDQPPRPKPARTLLPVVLDVAGQALPMPWSKDTGDTTGRRTMRGVMAWIDRYPALNKLFERFEYVSKRQVFGCEACGNCVLGSMAYVCPQTCPKQMRNGPCGGTMRGRCEVVDQECIWVSVTKRDEAADRVGDLKVFIPAPDRTLQGTASWINYFLNRDSRPGHPKRSTPARRRRPSSHRPPRPHRAAGAAAYPRPPRPPTSRRNGGPRRSACP